MAVRAQRNTKQRQVVLEELRKLTSHPTASTLYEIVRHRIPKISLGTVYRNLELLARAGTILKLDTAGEEARFDGNIHRHAHVRCIKCGRVDDIHAPELDLVGGVIHDSQGYHILDCRLQYLGVCPQCRAATTEIPTDSSQHSTEIEKC